MLSDVSEDEFRRMYLSWHQRSRGKTKHRVACKSTVHTSTSADQSEKSQVHVLCALFQTSEKREQDTQV